jgi:hypothetical protein
MLDEVEEGWYTVPYQAKDLKTSRRNWTVDSQGLTGLRKVTPEAESSRPRVERLNHGREIGPRITCFYDR